MYNVLEKETASEKEIICIHPIYCEEWRLLGCYAMWLL
jgi:hypothetical protein